MRYTEFLEWLQAERKLSVRSARDVVSRLKRAMIILGDDKVATESVAMLSKAPAFLECSMSVKSQLKRAVALYVEFQE